MESDPMKRLLVAGVLAGLMLSALPVHAHPTRDFEGGCSFITFSDTTPEATLGGPNRFTGVMYTAVYATDATYGVPEPSASIAIDCEIYINGVLADVALSASGTGAAAAVGTFSYEREDTDVVTLCDHVVVDGEDHNDCYGEDPQIPPQQFVNLIQFVIDKANELVFEPVVDPAICPALGDLAPGVPGVVDITPEGDASLPYDGGRFWDCPPYGS
jgi:hypothetical protein